MGERKAPSLPPSKRTKDDPVSRQIKPEPPPAPPEKRIDCSERRDAPFRAVPSKNVWLERDSP